MPYVVSCITEPRHPLTLINLCLPSLWKCGRKVSGYYMVERLYSICFLLFGLFFPCSVVVMFKARGFMQLLLAYLFRSVGIMHTLRCNIIPEMTTHDYFLMWKMVRRHRQKWECSEMCHLFHNSQGAL